MVDSQGDAGSGQDSPKPPVLPRSRFDHSLTALPRPATVGGAWSFLGPKPIASLKSYVTTPPQVWGNVSGRVTSLVTDPHNGSVVYLGSAGGGVWKSSNGGTNWSPISDTAASLAIGSLAISASGTTIVAGTGEENYSESIAGQGILISTNSGGSWTNLGRTTFGNHDIGGLAIDRRTTGATLRIFAASDLGLYESTNAGASWTPNATFASAALNGQAFQVIQDPSTSSIWWATSGTACKGCVDAKVLLSVNDGKTWKAVLFPTGASRIGLGVGTGGVAYASVADRSDALMFIKKTLNHGTSWTSTMFPPKTPDPPNPPVSYLGTQGEYDNVTAVDPTNNNNVVLGGVNVVSTTNGGSTGWTDVGKLYTGGTIHPDFHAIAFTAAQSFYIGNDGGMWKSANMGTAWTNLNATLAISQFYRGDVTDLKHVVGGMQDNAVAGFLGASTQSWTMYGGGGDGTFTAIDPTVASTTAYGASQFLGIKKVTAAAPTPGTAADPCGNGCANTAAAFVAPFVMDPSNPKRLLAAAGGGIFESRSGSVYTGGTPAGPGGWVAISGTLSRFVKDQVTHIAIGPPGETGVVFTLTGFGGQVFRSTDTLGAAKLPGGVATWTNITGNLPRSGTPYPGWLFASSVAFNPWNIDEAWVSTTWTGAGTARVWHTTNAGAGSPTWKALNGSLTSQPGLALAVDPRNPAILYLGSADGVYECTTCSGTSATGNWAKFGSGMPNVWVNDLKFTRDHTHLVAFTHGRGAWSIPTPDPTGGTSPIQEFPVSGAGSLQGAAAGPNGVWFVDQGSGLVGRVNRTGANITYAAGAPGDQLESIVAGPDGNMWYTAASGNYIGMIKPDGTGGVHYPTGIANAHPTGITVGPDLNLWVTLTNADAVAKFDPFTRAWGNVQGTPTHGSRPQYIAPGSDQRMWFTEFVGRNVAAGTLNSGIIIQEYADPHQASDVTGPYGITLGPDGNIWYSNWQHNEVDRVTKTGAITPKSLGSGIHGPTGLTPGPDGMVWVTDSGAQNNIVRIDPTTFAATAYPIPTANSNSWGITVGPDGNIWFTEAATGKVGRLQLSHA